MNKFETSLLQTLSSIDESLKALAGRKTPAAKAPKTPAAKPAAKPAPKVSQKTAKKPGNGALPKAAAKAARALEKAKGAVTKAKEA
jgi:hypothetical protein